MQPTFVVDDGGVHSGLPYRRTNRGHHVIPIGEHGLIHVSRNLVSPLAREGLITSGSARVGRNGEVVINSFIDPLKRNCPLVLFKITAVPARKQVTYDLRSQQVIIQRPVRRQFGARTHCWHEVLAWLRPFQQVKVTITSIVPDLVIDPQFVLYDGHALTMSSTADLSANEERSGSYV
jgi:hypothetical protein